MEWKPFGKDSLSGIYWVAGTRAIFDVDVGDDGRPVQREYLGDEPFVALVGIEFEPLADLSVDPINEYETGNFDLGLDNITHYAPFEMPEAPESLKAGA